MFLNEGLAMVTLIASFGLKLALLWMAFCATRLLLLYCLAWMPEMPMATVVVIKCLEFRRRICLQEQKRRERDAWRRSRKMIPTRRTL